MFVILISFTFTLVLIGISIIFDIYIIFLRITSESNTIIVRFWKEKKSMDNNSNDFFNYKKENETISENSDYIKFKKAA